MAGTQSSDLRFDVPLYTLAEASKYLVVPRPTLTTWTGTNDGLSPG
ncbi:Putative antitoxin VapB45 [Mycobacterium simulans]|uniref:Antitoxin VapB45 n=1 Tax=Mycobacterium simulans TaxID=627089 RepID=A0A7Z7N7W9_9MYCO|nr:Putative antitoxin VapB45 [Mycobacterium simulans]